MVEQPQDEELQVDEVLDEDEAFVEYDIASYPSDFTLSVVNEMWEKEEIVIPEFQRNFVWTIKQSSLLIESFLMGLPVPQVFFYIDETNKNLVIDGQQRILSIVYYFEGYFGSESIQGKRQVFRLSGLDKRSPYARKRFSDLDETARRGLRGSVLRAINIRQLHPSEGENTSIYHIFERLNTGGTPLKPQEIRNCVSRGSFVRMLRDLNDNSSWRTILGKQTLDKHQKDLELVLRVFSLYRDWKTYEKPMKEYLNRYMDRHKNAESDHVAEFVDRFPRAATLIAERLGRKPFHVRGPLNTSVLDSVFCTVLNNLEDLAQDFTERFQQLIKDEEFIQTTYYGTSDVSAIRSRFALAQKLLVRSS